MKTKNAWIYLNTNQCFGSHQGGWSREMTCRGELPTPHDLEEMVDERAFGEKRLGLLIMDDLLHPLRLKLDKPEKDPRAFLQFGLRHYLNFSVETAEVRFFPLSEELTYLTMALPKPWIEGVYAFFENKGVQLGHIGGLLTTLLSETKLGWNAVTIGIYREVYLLVEMDEKGGFVQFRTRRLPLAADGQLDIQTLVHSDWEGFMQPTPAQRAVKLLALTEDHQDQLATMRAELGRFRDTTLVPQLGGNSLARFQALLQQPSLAAAGGRA
ncbi:hypothetical protein [Acanthopleuribacter pedis]|uniref:Uncharacterized protein n=1 Tax=Acanthopleuribacter pedis TaxID=442870 RepID=A0A8J7Q0F1_9BACT|nr:hypothetical protein [Acanthopleuribacter pedis]MBO1318112.1 hypothetical protein [Acanthopleuribacter pedis]